MTTEKAASKTRHPATTETERRARAVELARASDYLLVPVCRSATSVEIIFEAPSRSLPRGEDGRPVTYEVRYDRQVDTFTCECRGGARHGYCAHIGAAIWLVSQIERIEREHQAMQAMNESKSDYDEDQQTERLREDMEGNEAGRESVAAAYWPRPVIESEEELHAAAFDLGHTFARCVWPFEGNPVKVASLAVEIGSALVDFVPVYAYPDTAANFSRTVRTAFVSGFETLFAERDEERDVGAELATTWTVRTIAPRTIAPTTPETAPAAARKESRG